jgi:hypothetical protein
VCLPRAYSVQHQIIAITKKYVNSASNIQSFNDNAGFSINEHAEAELMNASDKLTPIYG